MKAAHWEFTDKFLISHYAPYICRKVWHWSINTPWVEILLALSFIVFLCLELSLIYGKFWIFYKGLSEKLKKNSKDTYVTSQDYPMLLLRMILHLQPLKHARGPSPILLWEGPVRAPWKEPVNVKKMLELLPADLHVDAQAPLLSCTSNSVLIMTLKESVMYLF